MSQFDVFRSSRSRSYPLVLDIQADFHSSLTSRIVVPLVARAQGASRPLTRLTPIMAVRGEPYILLFPLMASIPKASLGELVESLATQRATLIAALDLLITGS
jgi:toxin CcdB